MAALTVGDGIRWWRAAGLSAAVGLIAATASAQVVQGSDGANPAGGPAGGTVSLDVQLPAEWGTDDLTYDGRGISRNTFLQRARLSTTGPCPAGRRCFSARFFLDYRLTPGDYSVTFSAVGHEGTRTFAAPIRVRRSPDDDGDGLPDLWENDHDLNRLSGVGRDGVSGDPDGDGVSNLDELRAGSNPMGRYRQYFGESSPGDRQRMYPCFFFTREEAAHTAVRIRLIGDDGRELTTNAVTGGACGMETDRFVADRVIAVEVESFDPIVIERQLHSGRDGYLSSSRAVGPSTDWHFAEGPSSGPVDVFFLAYNPESTPVTATFVYYRSADEAPMTTERTLGPGRTTVWINADEPQLRGDFAVAVHASAPILLDRGLRWHPPGRTAPQESASPGSPQLSAQWFFPHADGGKGSDERIVLANPNGTGTVVEIATYQADREPRVSYVTLGAHARAVVRTADLGADAPVGLRLVSTNGVAIVAEHMQQGLGSPDGRWAFAAPGAASAGTAWALPSLQAGFWGPVPPPPSQIVLFNPSTTDADVEVRALWYQGTYDTPTIRTYPFRVPAERLVMVRLVNAPIFDQPEGSITTIMRSAVIVSTPGRDGAEPRRIIVGRAARGGALGVPDARTEHYVGTRLR